MMLVTSSRVVRCKISYNKASWTCPDFEILLNSDGTQEVDVVAGEHLKVQPELGLVQLGLPY